MVSVLEIYNEMVRDLLSHQHTDKMEIKQGPEGNYVPGLTQVQVTCLQELNEVSLIDVKDFPFSIHLITLFSPIYMYCCAKYGN